MNCKFRELVITNESRFTVERSSHCIYSIVLDTVKGHGLYIYPVVLETVDFPVGWVFIVFAHTHAGSCKLCGVDMPSIVNSLIHHSSQRLHMESSSSGFLLDWNKRGHWQQWRSYRGRLGSTAIHQTVWCTFIHREIRCFFIRLNPTREPFIQF